MEHLPIAGAVHSISLVINIDEFAVRRGGRQIPFQQHFFGQDHVLQQHIHTTVQYPVPSVPIPSRSRPSLTFPINPEAAWGNVGLPQPLTSTQRQFQELHWISGTLAVFAVSRPNRCPPCMICSLLEIRDKPLRAGVPNSSDLPCNFGLLNGLEQQCVSLCKSIVKINNARCCPRTANARQGLDCSFLCYAEDFMCK